MPRKSRPPPFIISTMRRLSTRNNAARTIQRAYRKSKAKAARTRRTSILSFKRRFGFRNPYL